MPVNKPLHELINEVVEKSNMIMQRCQSTTLHTICRRYLSNVQLLLSEHRDKIENEDVEVKEEVERWLFQTTQFERRFVGKEKN